MPGLSCAVKDLAKKECIQNIVLADDCGFTITSTFFPNQKVSANGVHAIKTRLIPNSEMNYLIIVDKRGLTFLCHDDKFYYIIQSEKPVTEKVISKFRTLVDKEIALREKRRQVRLTAALKVKEMRKNRLELLRKRKKGQSQILLNLNQIKNRDI